LAKGYSEKLKPLQSLGYKQMIDFIGKRQSWEQTLDSINRETWQYAKRQMTWFGADKPSTGLGLRRQRKSKAR